jgi:hypothetical protein
MKRHPPVIPGVRGVGGGGGGSATEAVTHAALVYRVIAVAAVPM